MIEKLINASQNFLSILAEVEDSEGVIDESLEKKFDEAVKEMASQTDTFVNSLDYLETAIEVVKKRKDKYLRKERYLSRIKDRMRGTAKALLMSGVAFEGDESSVKLTKPVLKLNYDDVNVDELPDRYVRVKKEINKQALSDDIKEGKLEPTSFNIKRFHESKLHVS